MRELSMHLMDIIENSIKADADLIIITIEENKAENYLTMTVEDNGKGMDEEFLQRVFDPFVTSRTTRRVGLGLPLLKAAAERCGGKVKITSVPNQGTQIKAYFQHKHIDRAPMGNLAETLTAVIAGNPNVDFVYTHITPEGRYVLDTRTIKEILDEINISNPKVVEWIKKDIAEGLKKINGGVDE